MGHSFAYWSEELDTGRRTSNDLIGLFADSEEFTTRFAQYFGSGWELGRTGKDLGSGTVASVLR